MFTYSKFKKNGYTIICREDVKHAMEEFFNSPRKFIKEKAGKVYLTRPNLVAEVKFFGVGNFLVKSFGWRSVFHFLISPFRRSKAMRSFLVAQRLLFHRVPTPIPVCVLEKRCFSFVMENIYITEVVENYITVREYLQRQPEGYRKARSILPFLAEYVRNLHSAGVWHRDLHLTNFLMKFDKHGNPVFYIVDLNRARLFNRLPMWLRIFDIGKMDLHEFRADFIDYYLADAADRTGWERIFYIYGLLRRLRKFFLKGR
jgi:hypothetical protein